MMPPSRTHDPSAGSTELGLLRGLLSRADSPAALALHLTEQVQVLTGARGVVCVECAADEDEHRVVAVSPESLRAWADSPAARTLYSLLHQKTGTRRWHATAEPNVFAGLPQEESERALSVPLDVAGFRVGSLLLVGLPASEPLLAPALTLLDALSAVAALVLRNAVLYRKQEQQIHARTRELQAANQGLSAQAGRIRSLLEESERARHALLGLVEDEQQARGQIRQLKDDLANIIDSMPALLVGIDHNGLVTQWNREAARVTGVQPGDAVARPVRELLPAFAGWIDALASDARAGRPASVEKVPVDEGGERRLFNVMLYPLTATGAPGAVVRIEDVTERARIQELMIQTEKMMSVGGLAAGMAHEINNPLGIVTQAVQNIERRTIADLAANHEAAAAAGTTLEAVRAYHEQRDIPSFIVDIREAASRASQIVTNMLEFSRRSETGKSSADLASLLETSLRLAASDYGLKHGYDFRSIAIAREYDAAVPPVPVAAVEIEQVFLNLLTNAAHAMAVKPAGFARRITLRVFRDERHAVVQVEDNGSGMPPDVARRVFEPFFTTKPPGVGTGLGLSVAYIIVTQNHKGHIEVESSPGHGACFTVRLPIGANP